MVLMSTPVRGAEPGEITLRELRELDLWGFGSTRTWQLVTQERVIPYRQDRFRIYVKLQDAIEYQHKIKRGRPLGS